MTVLESVKSTPLPVIYLSKERFIYLGRAHLHLRDLHSGAAWLLVCLSGEVAFRLKDESQWTNAKSLLIPAGSKISIDNRGAVLSVCYLNAAEPDFMLLKRKMQGVTQGVYFHHKHEEKLIDELLAMREEEPGFYDAIDKMGGIIKAVSGVDIPVVDKRVQCVVKRLRETSSENVSVRELAEEVGMSESGLIKLFRLHVGAPIRKHRLWYRLVDFLGLVLSGVPTKKAIKEAGFSDASHLSRSYSGLFGVTFSYALSKDRKVKYILSDKTIERDFSS